MFGPAKALNVVGILTLLCCLATRQVSSFDSDKLYKYEFEGAITSKVSDDEKPQFAGVALTSPIRVRKSGSNELTIQLDKPQLATFNDVIEEIHLYKYQYAPLSNQQATGLDRAFRIYFDSESGSVKSFDSYKDEPKWVTNFKRGLLSFFHLKLRESSGSNEAVSPHSNQYYSIPEKSIFGECETDYLVMMNPLTTSETHPEQQFAINVTKSRNLARCKGRFLHRFFPIDANECVENEKDLRQYKHSNAILQYDLIGSKQNYVIQQVLLDEVSTFAPFGQRAHGHLLHSKFMMKLMNVEEVASSWPQIDGDPIKIDSLAYEPPETSNFYSNINLDQEHHLSSIYQSSASVEQVMQAFEALVQEQQKLSGLHHLGEQVDSKQVQSSRLAELFLRLNELMGNLNVQKIEQVYGQVDERGEAHKKIFWDLMSVTGTNPSFNFMRKLIIDGDAPSVKIKDFLTRLSYHIKMPSKTLFDEYVNLCKSDKIQTNQQYKRLCLLPLASLIHQHCVKPHGKFLRTQQEPNSSSSNASSPNTCQLSTAEDYFSRLIVWPQSRGEEEPMALGDKMLQVKLAGELGVRQSIDYLMLVVANKQEHPALRSASMWQLYKAARLYPSQVKRHVIPIYNDRNELLEIRLASFQNWLVAGMQLHEMETIARRLWNEPSRQLVIYVHSLLQGLSQLEPGVPCGNSNHKNALLVLPVVKRALARHSAPNQLTDSWASLSSSWQQEYGYGTTSFTSVIFSNDSMAPSNLYHSSSEIMSGLKLTPRSISIQAHGLDKLIKRVVGIQGMLADKESFMDVFSLKRRLRKRQATESVKQEAQELDGELKVAPRSELHDVYLAITVSAYGRPVTFFDRDSRELKKMLSEDGTIKIPAIKKLIHSFNNHTSQQMLVNFEKLELFNNELGLPLYQAIQDFDYQTIKLNSIKLDVEPGFFKEERQGRPPNRFLVALDAKMSRHNEMLVSSGSIVASHKQQVGVGLHKKKLVNVPVRLSLEANLTQDSISLSAQPVQENLVYVKQTPVTFLKSYDPARDTSSSSSLEAWRPLYQWNETSQMKAFKLEHMSSLGLGFRLEGFHRAGQDWSMAAWRRHLSQIGLSAAKLFYTYSPGGQPLEARFSLTSAETTPSSPLQLILSWRHHHERQESSLNEIEQELEKATSTGGSSEQLPSTVSYKLVLLGAGNAGSNQQRSVALDLAYSSSHDRLLHKWRASYERTLSNDEQDNKDGRLCLLGEMRFPKHEAGKLLDLELNQLDHSANLTSEIFFGGQPCLPSNGPPSNSRVTARIAFDWSQEQRQAIELALAQAGETNHRQEEKGANVYSRLYNKCLAKRELHGAKLEPACLELLSKTGELTHISAQFDYKEVPEHWTKLVRRLGGLYTYARAGYIEEMDDRGYLATGDRYKAADGQRDRAHLEANISLADVQDQRLLSYEFDTPNYHVLYKNVPISIPPLSTFPLLGSSSLYQQLQNRAGTQSCLVSGQWVTTFDQLTYKMPDTGECLKLIAKDCSAEANYLVLGAKRGKNGKLLKVLLGQKFKVEFVPDAVTNDDGKTATTTVTIKINDETVQLEQDKLALKREIKVGQKTEEAFRIDYNGAYYTLDSKLYKFSVSTDGTWISVQQSKYYSGKSCGLCGDSNGDQLLEFKSPSNRVCKSANEFVWSNIPPNTCGARPKMIECS